MNIPVNAESPLGKSSLPTLFVDSDTGAKKAEKRLLALTAVLLIGSIAAATFGVFSLEHRGRDYAAIGSLAGLGLSLLATLGLALDNPKKRWYDLRALAESVKSLGVLYAVAGGDFARDERGDREAREDFAARLAELREQFGSELKEITKSPLAITDAMQGLREQPLKVRRAAYHDHRLREQKGWYARRSGDHSRAGTKWLLTSGTAQAAGFFLAALRLFEVVRVDLSGIAATAAVAAAAWLRTNDHAGIAEAYRQTAHELGEIEASIDDAADEAEWATWVLSAETAMSREHTSWLARRRTLL